jgi:hypothetical protein
LPNLLLLENKKKIKTLKINHHGNNYPSPTGGDQHYHQDLKEEEEVVLAN